MTIFNKKGIRHLVLGLALVTLLGWTACTKKDGVGGSTPQAATSNEIWFGEFGSMTGSESTFGIATHKGILMALEDANKAGGVKGKKIELKSYDDQGQASEAVTTVTKLVTQDKVMLLLGEVASSRSIAAGAVAQQYQVPMVSPSSTNPKVTQIGDYVFRVCFIDPFQGSVMAKFAINNLKLKKAAILRDVKSDYSVGLSNFFTEEYKKMGGEIVKDESYSSGDVDFKSQLTAIKGKNPDVLFLSGYYTETGLIAKQARELNVKAVFLGGDGWDSEKLTQIGGDAIIGGYFSSHYSHEDQSPVVQNFVNQYKAKYGELPNGLAAMGYDAALVAIDAAKRATELTPKGLRDALAQTKNFQGVTGMITINEERNAIKSAVVLKVAGPEKFSFVTTVNPY